MSEFSEDIITNYKHRTWVLDGKEYILTGRVAKKLMGRTERYLLEIVPNSETIDLTYARWTDIKDLYLVENG